MLCDSVRLALQEAALAQQAEKLKEENAQILKKIKQERKRRQRVQVSSSYCNDIPGTERDSGVV